jgi:hypothetical protein
MSEWDPKCGFPLKGSGGSMLLKSKLINTIFTDTTLVVRPDLLKLVLISGHRGAD